MTATPPLPPLQPGRIDVHSHLLAGIDDGCETPDESLACVRRLISLGFAGTVCTPHVVPDLFPTNTPANIAVLVSHLQEDIVAAGLPYRVWPGAEVRISEKIVEWMKRNGVPTLAGSRCVLLDFWADKWPKWVVKTFEWLLAEKYQPVLAHPERTNCCKNDPKTLEDLLQMGVWLQGNTRAATGEDGYAADQMVRGFLSQGKYQFLALDMHRLESLDGRFDGMQIIAAEFGDEVVDKLMREHPRKLLELV